MTARTQPQQDRKVHRRPRLLALWSPALVASARSRAVHLHPGRPRLDWETAPDGFLELRKTVRGAGCAACGRKLAPDTLALYGHAGDDRTPHKRYLCLERCTGARPRPELVQVPAAAPASPVTLAQRGLYRPDLLTHEDIRVLCEQVLQAGKGRTA